MYERKEGMVFTIKSDKSSDMSLMAKPDNSKVAEDLLFLSDDSCWNLLKTSSVRILPTIPRQQRLPGHSYRHDKSIKLTAVASLRNGCLCCIRIFSPKMESLPNIEVNSPNALDLLSKNRVPFAVEILREKALPS